MTVDRLRRRWGLVGRCGSALRVASLAAVPVALALSGTARAAADTSFLPVHTLTGLAIVGGVTASAIILALLHLWERGRWTRRERDLVGALDALRGAHDRAEMLLASEPQIIVTWDRHGEPAIEGEVGLAFDGGRPAAGAARRVLAFGTWLVPADAAALDAAVEGLRERGASFRLTISSRTGTGFEAQGLTTAGRALLRLREISHERAEIAELRETLGETRRGLSALAGLIDGLPQPVWRRNREGGLVFVNAAYVAAVEAGSREAALEAGTELLDRPARDLIARADAARRGAHPAQRLSAVVAGSRRMLDVFETPLESGRVGIAVDVSELEQVRADLQRQMNANVRTLDQLPTAVAMFDDRQRLIFHNAAYRQLWDLDPAFLDGRPLDGEILDHLRAQRKLEEQADFRAWKQRVLGAYRAVEANETWWYLPDNRTLRVVADPNPQGGLTYLFDDVSDRMALESRYNALMRVQAETLDTLKEPVAVFGTDGRLTVHNRAFATLWRLDPPWLEERPRIEAVIDACRPLTRHEEPWLDIRDAVVRLGSRAGLTCRLDMADGSVLDCATQPLPDGATLLTLIDVTASVNVERALTDKNDALEKAAQLRDTFVHHVSYELRSPLTTIIGFTQLLGDETVGALNQRQREYADHITRSSSALLAIITDICDLASIDAGSLELQREMVDVQETVTAALRGLEDRLADSGVQLAVDVPADVGRVWADGKRVRQILFNLLSNAMVFSDAGQSIELRARRTAGELTIEVRDHGRGMPPEVAERVFERFESHGLGTRHRGVGLGLSIVRSFVELHGGRVVLDTAPDRGTRVACLFPIVEPETRRDAAE